VGAQDKKWSLLFNGKKASTQWGRRTRKGNGDSTCSPPNEPNAFRR
jgi:hypothetical protein